LNGTYDFVFLVYLWRRERNEDHCIIVEHGALMEYERNIFDVWKNSVSIIKVVILMLFFSYFHYWILILKLALIEYE